MNAMAERWNKAAVVRTKGGPFEMETIHLEEPRQDEVLIRIVATGICHTDAHVRDPASTVPVPAVLGREGAGVVERLGSRVPCRENVFQLPEMTMKAAAQLVEEHALTLRESLQGSMRTCLLALLCLLLCSCTHTEARNTDTKDVTLWYEAFNTKDPVLIDRILSENWVDIPAAPGQPTGREGAKHLLVELTTTFPDLKVTIEEILQDGNKVIVRSEITGTQSKTFMGFPAKNRTMTIMAIDIHEFKDGKIVRTWHTEDWLTGLHQLGVFEK